MSNRRIYCSCSKHEEFSVGKEFKVYKIQSKKFKQGVTKLIRDQGYLGLYSESLCTACAAVCEADFSSSSENIPSVKQIKTDLSCVDTVMKSIKENVLSEEILTKLASALGKSQKDDIYNDSTDITSGYNVDSVLKSFNAKRWLSEKNCILTSFILSAAGFQLNNNESDISELNNKKAACIVNSIECIYKARCLKLVTPFSFSKIFFSTI